MTVTMVLPFPPSVNHYWGARGKTRYIAAAGKAFRAEVLARWYEARAQGFGRKRLAVSIVLHPGDRRRRDVDNCCKAILDALAAARVFEDDEQVDDLHTKRGAIRRGDACVVVTVREAA